MIDTNREKYLALRKANYQRNKKTWIKYQQAHKEDKAAYDKQYSIDNKERISEFQKNWREANKEKRREYHILYSQTLKGKLILSAAASKRRARNRNAEGNFNANGIKNLYATQGGRCYYCSVEIENGYHIEHMTPLSRGGSNWIDNICLACVSCNKSKYTKTAEEFMAC